MKNSEKTMLNNEFTITSFDRDVLLCNDLCRAHFGGDMAELIRFMYRHQIKDVTLWKRFVHQFTFNSDDDRYGWRCEYWGKMMRGAAAVYGYTRDKMLYAILEDSVRELLRTQDSLGRISTYSVNAEFHEWDMWGRKYVLLGLQYFMEVCEDEALKDQIRHAMCLHLDYIIDHLGEDKLPIEMTSKIWLGANSCSILEPVVRLYNSTGDKRYLDFASYIVEVGFGKSQSGLKSFAEAYENKAIPSDYCENKAYETMSCFEGLAEYYRVTGDEKAKIAVRNFAYQVLHNEMSVIGTSGCKHELFDNTRLHQVDPAFNGIMQETCVSVTWIKFCGQMLRLFGDPVFADSMEITFFNAFLGSMNTYRIPQSHVKKTGEHYCEILPFDSYSALRPGMRGQGVGGQMFMEDGSFYGCCACISPVAPGILPRLATMLSRDGVVLNLYLPGDQSVLTPSGAELRILSEGGYPYEDTIRLTLLPEREEKFSISFRIPAWSSRCRLVVNGKEERTEVGYTKLTRVWKTGDKIELTFDLRLTRIDPPEDSPYSRDYVALRRGCLVLATDRRLGEDPDEPVSIAFDAEGHVEGTPAEHPGVPDCKLCLSVPQTEGEPLKLMEYSAAGKTWDDASRYAAWMPLKK